MLSVLCTCFLVNTAVLRDIAVLFCAFPILQMPSRYYRCLTDKAGVLMRKQVPFFAFRIIQLHLSKSRCLNVYGETRIKHESERVGICACTHIVRRLAKFRNRENKTSTVRVRWWVLSATTSPSKIFSNADPCSSHRHANIANISRTC